MASRMSLAPRLLPQQGQALGCRQWSSLPVLIAAAWSRGTNERTGLDLEPS